MKTKETFRNEQGECLICGDTAKTLDGNCFYCSWKKLEMSETLKKEIQKGKEENFLEEL